MAKVRHNGALRAALRLPSRGAYFNQVSRRGKRARPASPVPIAQHMINADRLTVKSAEALNEAIAQARRAGNPLVYDLHLLSALLGQD